MEVVFGLSLMYCMYCSIDCVVFINFLFSLFGAHLILRLISKKNWF